MLALSPLRSSLSPRWSGTRMDAAPLLTQTAPVWYSPSPALAARVQPAPGQHTPQPSPQHYQQHHQRGGPAAATAAAQHQQQQQPYMSTSDSSSSEGDSGPVRVPLKLVVQDAVKRWFNETLSEARRGDVKQQALLAQMYTEGYGCSQDLEQAKVWADRAKQRGYQMVGVYCSAP